jgi:hypothetical protein
VLNVGYISPAPSLAKTGVSPRDLAPDVPAKKSSTAPLIGGRSAEAVG